MNPIHFELPQNYEQESLETPENPFLTLEEKMERERRRMLGDPVHELRALVHIIGKLHIGGAPLDESAPGLPLTFAVNNKAVVQQREAETIEQHQDISPCTAYSMGLRADEEARFEYFLSDGNCGDRETGRIAAYTLLSGLGMGVEALSNGVAKAVSTACSLNQTTESGCSFVAETAASAYGYISDIASEYMPDAILRVNRGYQTVKSEMQEDARRNGFSDESSEHIGEGLDFLLGTATFKVGHSLVSSTRGGVLQMLKEAKAKEAVAQTMKAASSELRYTHMSQSTLLSSLPVFEAAYQQEALTAYTASLPKLPPRYSIVNSFEHLSELTRGRSGANVYFLKDGERMLYVIKEFELSNKPYGSLAKELVARETLSNLRTPFRLPEFSSVAKVNNKGALAMSVMDGTSFVDLMKDGTSRFMHAMEKLGEGIGHLHQTSLTAHAPSRDFLRKEIAFAEKMRGALRQHLPGFSVELDERAAAFLKNPGRSSIVHGDVHLPNFVFNPDGTVATFDVKSLSKSLDSFGRGQGSSLKDIHQVEMMLKVYGNQLGKEQAVAKASYDAFLNGYKRFAGLNTTKEAAEFYKTYWELASAYYLVKDHPTITLEEIRRILR